VTVIKSLAHSRGIPRSSLPISGGWVFTSVVKVLQPEQGAGGLLHELRASRLRFGWASFTQKKVIDLALGWADW